MNPFVVALCPTYRHPKLLANSLQLWLDQDYPLEDRCLIILDDEPTFDNQQGPGWILWAVNKRFDSLPAKYNFMLRESLGAVNTTPEIYVVWEDDDIYLPNYVSSHVRALTNAEYSKSKCVASDYTRTIQIEKSAGRFHSTIAFRKTLIDRIGGWPDTHRADFDQQLMHNLMSNLEDPVNGYQEPWDEDTPKEIIPFIYRWHSGAAHCQTTMKSQDDTTWYERGEKAYTPVPFEGTLKPCYDTFTKEVLNNRGYNA